MTRTPDQGPRPEPETDPPRLHAEPTEPDESASLGAEPDTANGEAGEHHAARPPRHWFSWWGRVRYFVIHKILRASDSPHRIALGVGIGMWVALLPLVGIQMITSAALCHPVKGNKVVSMAMAWVSNPITLVPIFLPCYWLGCWLLGLDAIPYEDFVAIFFPEEGSWWARVSATWRAMMGIFGPLWLGSLIVATTVAVPTYFITERVVTWYRLRRYGTTDLTTLPELAD